MASPLKNPAQSDPLAALHDIHAPEAIAWWPPAPGWWLLLLLILGLALALWWYRRRDNPPTKDVRVYIIPMALQELEELKITAHQRPNREVLMDLSALLKRAAQNVFTKEIKNPAAMTGQEWLAWLDQKQVSAAFSSDTGQLFVDGIYRSDAAVSNEQLEKLFLICRNWLEAQVMETGQ